MPVIQFATNSYRSNSLPVSAQRVVNVFAEMEPKDAKTPVALFECPGLVNFATCGAGPVRAMRVMNGMLYVVSGDTLYSVSAMGVVTPLGGAVSGSGVVSMSDNGTQICIVNGTNGYIYSATSGFQLISSANFHPAKTVTFFDTYFVFDWAGTNKYFISASLDGTTFNGLDFAAAEVAPDFVLATVNQQENLLIFGETTTETWYDAGAVTFPFLRVDGATIERGCGAALSTVKEDNSVFFLGNDRIFYRLNGTQPVRVSTHAIEDAWQQYTIVSDAFTFSYTYNGHKFVVVTFPDANATWEFDVSTNLWHERESWDINGRSYGRWRGNCQANVYNKVMIGDAYSGQVGFLDEVYTEFGNTLWGQAIGTTLHNDRKRIFISRFELDIEAGVGLTDGQGSNPQIMMDYSRDGGRTFSNLQIWNSMGRIGAFNQRVRWLRLGNARQWTPRITISDPIKRVIVAAHADIAAGTG